SSAPRTAGRRARSVAYRRPTWPRSGQTAPLPGKGGATGRKHRWHEAGTASSSSLLRRPPVRLRGNLSARASQNERCPRTTHDRRTADNLLKADNPLKAPTATFYALFVGK